MERRIKAALGLLFLGVMTSAGQSTDAGKMVITSKKLEFDYRRSIAVFEEDVVVVDPQMRLQSEKLNVIFDGTNDVKAVTATGDVHIWHADKTATCRRAIYLAESGQVILQGDAELSRGRDTVKGDEITFWLNEERMSCKPGYLVIFPDEDEDRQ